MVQYNFITKLPRPTNTSKDLHLSEDVPRLRRSGSVQQLMCLSSFVAPMQCQYRISWLLLSAIYTGQEIACIEAHASPCPKNSLGRAAWPQTLGYTTVVQQNSKPG